MELQDALNIIGMVADGLNPYKKCGSLDDVINDLPENNPVTIRAICTAIISLVPQKDRDNLALNYKSKCLEELKELVSGPLKEALDNNKHRLEIELPKTELTQVPEADREIALVEWVKDALSTQESENLFDMLMDKYSRIILVETLKITKGNRSHAARLLGLTRPTLHSKLERYSID